MLFTQLNGQDRPVDDRTEIDVLQNIACEIGPRVDGIHAPRSLPQAMGAFVTSGAQGACAGRGQQMEQHTPTTFGFGQAAMSAEVAPSTPAPTPAPTTGVKTFTNKFLLANVAIPKSQMQLMTLAPDKLIAPPVPPPGPGTPAPEGTYPPGSITAFSAKTNMWRVAIPFGTTPPPPPAAGFGDLFGLGADAAFTEVPSVQAPPVGVTQVPEKELEAKTGTLPFFKKPLFWAIVAGSVVVVGTGGYFMFRRKPAAPAPAKAVGRRARKR